LPFCWLGGPNWRSGLAGRAAASPAQVDLWSRRRRALRGAGDPPWPKVPADCPRQHPPAGSSSFESMGSLVGTRGRLRYASTPACGGPARTRSPSGSSTMPIPPPGLGSPRVLGWSGSVGVDHQLPAIKRMQD